MNVIYDLDKLEGPLKSPVLSIGNFDGVHRGHLALFDKVKERARALQGQSAVMTFEPHPMKVMGAVNGPLLITPMDQKLNLIDQAGIEVIFCISFTSQFASISAYEFVKGILVDKIGVREIVVGYDYTFGHKRQGNIRLLRELGDRYDFLVHVMEPIHIHGALVSSTSIRELIQAGHLAEAQKLLGRDYQISGTVVRGKNRGGRLLGFPTANMNPMNELLPKQGVYAVQVLVHDRVYQGVTNVGYNPTFGDTGLTIETHLLDFSLDILDETITITFIERLRDEMTFEGVEELSAQIQRDIQQARKLFDSTKTG